MVKDLVSITNNGSYILNSNYDMVAPLVAITASNQTIVSSSQKKLLDKNLFILSLKYLPPSSSLTSDKIVMEPLADFAELGAKKQDSCVIGFFLKRHHSLLIVKNFVLKKWGSSGPRDISSLR